MDIKVMVPRVPVDAMTQAQRQQAESSATVRERVGQARIRQQQRQHMLNSRLSSRACARLVVDNAARALLNQTMAQTQGSMRWYAKTLKVSRTIADLANSGRITTAHIAEAQHYTAPS